jgi:replication factor C large subunit
LDEQPETTLLWIEENMPAVYADKKSIQDSMHYLARADQFLGRITRRQYWGFLRYVSELMTAGVTVNRPERMSFARYVFPSYIAAMGRTKKIRSLSKSIGGKIGPLVHASNKIVAAQYIPLYRELIKTKKITAEEAATEVKLDEEELEFVSG